ncbi:hypothetical protein MJO28_005227 [Puccinia striiformis f. sp. tritici]|uniref:Secreted protein n=4 Tax=Puccinia striiformis TaxID=27350 RepID=A0A0L0UTN3_9BASI|nr:hypothetical protein Pst134EA_009397 [Puccinia striiformis f. sp. tritici]KAI9622891.1 hypothetical protein H4Q26_014830 [Puccinia striiformis f. sp. tritici PST-130]KNE90398.1 hypothetical protein PSTG_16144 [Puccinia striiformis f. sp. tritici PST-78]POW06246.1 hypothetical protein PSHT_10453 [Puccinia striiformis]KAH9458159.1 hypothetical protein Pst134EB_010461 [Puccinia striiformis f. sp. tritici]KAH9468868.1 hypothetical protein Pst134EA_009397 [Puccinia striiformis f. sp. tritici]
MLVNIPFTTLVALVSCGSILSAPGLVQNSTAAPLTRRQVTSTSQVGMKNMTSGAGNPTKMVMAMNGSPAQMTAAQKEAQEEAEEKMPGLNTIANAMNELYFHDKYGSQRNEPAMLLKMVGQAAGGAGKSGDPEVVSKAMLATFVPYNQGKPSAISASPITPLNKNTAGMEDTPSLKTIAHSLHESYEKLMTMTPKPDNAQLIPVFCQAIAASASSGDAASVSKAIDATYAKMAGN